MDSPHYPPEETESATVEEGLVVYAAGNAEAWLWTDRPVDPAR